MSLIYYKSAFDTCFKTIVADSISVKNLDQQIRATLSFKNLDYVFIFQNMDTGKSNFLKMAAKEVPFYFFNV